MEETLRDDFSGAPVTPTATVLLTVASKVTTSPTPTHKGDLQRPHTAVLASAVSAQSSLAKYSWVPALRPPMCAEPRSPLPGLRLFGPNLSQAEVLPHRGMWRHFPGGEALGKSP